MKISKENEKKEKHRAPIVERKTKYFMTLLLSFTQNKYQNKNQFEK